MDRDIELRIKGHLYEITSVNDEVLESRQGFPASETGYEKTLTSVADSANAEMVDQVAKSIKEHIQAKKERPDNQSVRREARMLLANEEIVADDYLMRA